MGKSFTAQAFFVATKPRSKANSKVIGLRGRNGKPFIRSSRASRAAEDELVLLLKRHRPQRPLAGPVRVDLMIVLEVPKKFKAAERLAAQAGHLYPAKRGTLDRVNACKLVEDALQAASYVVDDAQICAGELGKRYARADEPEGYLISIEPLEVPA